MLISKVVSGVVLAACLTACFPFKRPPEMGSATPPMPGTRGSAELWAKRVSAKRAPATLLASDGSTCQVTPDRYASTETGSLALCEWLRTPAP